MDASQAPPSALRPAGLTLRGFGWRPITRRRPVISGLELAIEPGERVLLAGPSGSGKSTVLAAAAGVLGGTVDGELFGDVEVDGTAGLLLQNPYDSVVADRIGRDVAFGLENLAFSRDRMWPRIHAALESVGLAYPMSHPTSALSGGELQRLALAGVLAVRPGLLLLDEPTSMLDTQTAATVRRAVLDAVEASGATLLVVEHRIADWLPAMDRVVVLEEGGDIAADTSPDRLDAAALPGRESMWLPEVPAPAPLEVPYAVTEPVEPPACVRAHGLSVELRTRTLRGTTSTTAVRNVEAVLEPATLTAFTGRSGSGKSTLLAALAGLVAPSRGRIAYADGAPHRMRSLELARRVGWVPQNPEHGFLTAKVREEITRTSQVLGRWVDGDAILEVFGLGHLADANPYRISGGEQRRLGLAAALAHRPGVVLLDEPTVGQDRMTWAAVVGWLASARDAGAVCGVATHDPDLVAVAQAQLGLEAGSLR